MNPGGKLIKTLKALGNLIEEEAARNPRFAEALEAIVNELPSKSSGKAKGGKSKATDVPDVFSEYEARGEEETRFWLRSLSLPQLKAIVKANGFDPEKKSARWDDSHKFIDLIVTQTAARLKRGSAFLEAKSE